MKLLVEVLPFAPNLLICTGLIYQIVRAHYVRLFREELVQKILTFLDPEWRFVEYDKVRYETMVWSFKRLKVENYYPNDAFLKPTKGLVVSPFQPAK